MVTPAAYNLLPTPYSKLCFFFHPLSKGHKHKSKRLGKSIRTWTYKFPILLGFLPTPTLCPFSPFDVDADSTSIRRKSKLSRTDQQCFLSLPFSSHLRRPIHLRFRPRNLTQDGSGARHLSRWLALVRSKRSLKLSVRPAMHGSTLRHRPILCRSN